MKTLLKHLNDVSRERGFRDFMHCTDDGRVYVVEDIIEIAGNRYGLEACKEALKNASTCNVIYVDTVDENGEETTGKVIYQDDIISETNIPKEVRNVKS